MFAGDALSHVAFTGALAALRWGIDPRVGLFVACIGFAGDLRPRSAIGGKADDVVIGTVFAWILGLGVLVLSLYTACARAGGDGKAGVTVLFGSIFGLSEPGVCRGWHRAVASRWLLARPLLFATMDQTVAAARGVPVRLLGVGFLLVVGASAAEATQAVGALLLLGLLAAPAGAAQRLTSSPYVGMALSCGLAVIAMVGGLATSYVAPTLPPSFAILTIATGGYAITFAVPRRRNRRFAPVT